MARKRSAEVLLSSLTITKSLTSTSRPMDTVPTAMDNVLAISPSGQWSSARTIWPTADAPARSAKPTRRVGAPTSLRSGRLGSWSSVARAADGRATGQWQRSPASLSPYCRGGGGGIAFTARRHQRLPRRGASANTCHHDQPSLHPRSVPFPKRAPTLACCYRDVNSSFPLTREAAWDVDWRGVENSFSAAGCCGMGFAPRAGRPTDQAPSPTTCAHRGGGRKSHFD